MKRFYFFYENGKLKFDETPKQNFAFIRVFASEKEAKKFVDKKNSKYFLLRRKEKMQ